MARWPDSTSATTTLVRIATVIEELGVPAPCVGFSNTEQARPFLERGVVSAVIDEKRYQLGYFCRTESLRGGLKEGRERDSGQRANSLQGGVRRQRGRRRGFARQRIRVAVRQRTEILVSYKTSLEEANLKLLDMTVTDALTGLFNRRKFEENLHQEVSRAFRYGPVSLLNIDLDYFKQVNDRYGHQAGDDALKIVAGVLQASCRGTDTCARLGGDEFGIILPHSDSGAAEVVRQRIEQQIARTALPFADGELRIGLSIGVASLPGDAGNAAELVAAADAAMYRAKQASRFKHAPVSDARSDPREAPHSLR